MSNRTSSVLVAGALAAALGSLGATTAITSAGAQNTKPMSEARGM